jgi:hypothetical protein
MSSSSPALLQPSNDAVTKLDIIHVSNAKNPTLVEYKRMRSGFGQLHTCFGQSGNRVTYCGLTRLPFSLAQSTARRDVLGITQRGVTLTVSNFRCIEGTLRLCISLAQLAMVIRARWSIFMVLARMARSHRQITLRKYLSLTFRTS